MKPIFTSIFIILCLCIPSFAQDVVEVDKPRREIRFIDLTQKENAPFFRRNREVSRLIIHSLQVLAIFPYSFDKTGTKVELLDIDKCWKRMSVNPFPDTPIEEQVFETDSILSEADPSSEVIMEIKDLTPSYIGYLFATDITTLGIDQTIGIKDNKEYAQVHFVHLYAHDSIAKRYNIDPYLFSLKWEDFLKAINETPKPFLYYTNSHGCWWHGDVFLTHGDYAIDHGMSGEFILLCQKTKKLPAKDYKKPGQLYDLNGFKEKTYVHYPLDIFIREKQTNGISEISNIILETIPDWWNYGKGDRMVFDWKDFLTIAADSGWGKSQEIYLLEDAFLLKKFKYSKTKKPIVLSKKGMFLKGGADPLCSNKIYPSFQLKNGPSVFEHFHTNYYEGLFLEDTLNQHLHLPGRSIVELIHENIFNGNLTVFTDDSLNQMQTLDETYNRASLIIKSKEYDPRYAFRKGDTVHIYFDHLGNKNPYTTSEFILLEDLPADPFRKDSSLFSKIKPCELPLYPPQQLNILDVVHTITFDKKGKNKKYHLLAIGINIPHNKNIKGLQFPVGYVLWSELRELLLKDKRAMIHYKGKPINLVELMEQREYFSYFYKTGILEVHK